MQHSSGRLPPPMLSNEQHSCSPPPLNSEQHSRSPQPPISEQHSRSPPFPISEHHSRSPPPPISEQHSRSSPPPISEQHSHSQCDCVGPPPPRPSSEHSHSRLSHSSNLDESVGQNCSRSRQTLSASGQSSIQHYTTEVFITLCFLHYLDQPSEQHRCSRSPRHPSTSDDSIENVSKRRSRRTLSSSGQSSIQQKYLSPCALFTF